MTGMTGWIIFAIVWLGAGFITFAFSRHRVYLAEKLGLETDDDESDWRDDFVPHLITYTIFGFVTLFLFVACGPITEYRELLSKKNRNASNPPRAN